MSANCGSTHTTCLGSVSDNILVVKYIFNSNLNLFCLNTFIIIIISSSILLIIYLFAEFQ